MIWTCTIPLTPESKANSRIIARKGNAGRRISIKSPKARAFVEAAALYMRVHGLPFGQIFMPWERLKLSWTVRYPDNRRDFVASIELIADALEASGVIDNDRQIREFGPSGAYDETGDPLIELRLESAGRLVWKKEKR